MALDYGMFSQMFNETYVSGQSWAVGLIVIVLSVLVITRDSEDWWELLPIMSIGWMLSGLVTSIAGKMVVGLIVIISTIRMWGVKGFSNLVTTKLTPKKVKLKRRTKKYKKEAAKKLERRSIMEDLGVWKKK